MPAMIASGDFTNIATNNAADGVYTINGAPCAITDIIDVAHADNMFDPVADIDAGGIKTGGEEFNPRQFAIKEPIRSSLLANGFTLLLEEYFDDTEAHLFGWCYDSPDFNALSAGEFRYSEGTPTNTKVTARVADSDRTTDASHVPVKGQLNRLCATFTSDHVSVSVNGSAAITHAGTAFDPGMNTILIGMAGQGTVRLRSFAFYEPVADADLPALSALY